MNSPFFQDDWFYSFIAPGADRRALIEERLRGAGVPARKVLLAGHEHIVVKYASDAYDPCFRMKTLIAHYDRADGSPGANDNSAACRILAEFAVRLAQTKNAMGTHNCMIIFTDGEEAAGESGIAAQGSFALGEGFRKLGITDDDIYVFDACGRGDTLIVSTSGIDRAPKGALADKLADLHARTAHLAAEASPGSWIRIPTPFSDNAGLLASGIASQVVSVLPREEATLVLAAPGAGKEGEDYRSALERGPRSTEAEPWADRIPDTWKRMHTERDIVETLAGEAFALTSRFLECLARKKELRI